MKKFSTVILSLFTVAFVIVTWPTIRSYFANNTRTQVHRINQ